MGKYAAAAKKGMKDVEEELAEGIEKLKHVSKEKILKLFPIKEQPRMDKLLTDLAKSTSSNERIARFKKAAGKFSAGSMKVLKKAMGTMAFIAICCALAHAGFPFEAIVNDLKARAELTFLSNAGPAALYDIKSKEFHPAVMTTIAEYRNFALQFGGVQSNDGVESTHKEAPVVSISYYLGPVIKEFLYLPSEWVFLNRLLLGPYYAKNFENGDELYGASFALSFGLGE